MDRRNFIRVAGGGVVLATGFGISGCSTAYPTDAISAWRGPGSEPDLRRWALGYAVLAPNSHNVQPWLVDLKEGDAITLYVDRERLLPMTDPWFRQIMVSHGTFIEALTIALHERGITPRVELFPQGEFAARAVDERPVARISWSGRKDSTQGPASVPKRDPLFGQLLRRHTAKVDYDLDKPVAATTLEALRSALLDADVQFGATTKPQLLEELRTLCFESAKVELLTPRTVMESVRLTRVGPDEIERHRDGISINGLMPRFADMVGAFDRDNPPEAGSAAYKQMMARFEGHSRTAMGFVWLSTDTAEHGRNGSTRSAEVRAGRTYMRLHLKATELGLQMHPMSQAPQEFPEMRPYYERMHNLLVGRPAEQRTVQMFCRVGYCPDQQHSPRRGVDAIIRA